MESQPPQFLQMPRLLTQAHGDAGRARGMGALSNYFHRAYRIIIYFKVYLMSDLSHGHQANKTKHHS